MSLPDVIMPDVPQEDEPMSPSTAPSGKEQPPREQAEEQVVEQDEVDTEKLESMIGDIQMPPQEQEAMKVKPVLEDETVFKDVKPKKAKSQKQLEHLARAREKALLVRQANAQAKRSEAKKVSFAEQATHQDTRPKEKKESLILHLSVAELKKMTEQASNQAVEQYDTRRKAQKKAKRDAQEEYNKANQVNQKINKALGVADPDDFWNQCFQ